MSQINLDLATMVKVNRFITLAIAEGVNAGQAQLLDALQVTMKIDEYWDRVLGDKMDPYIEAYRAADDSNNNKVSMDPIDSTTAAIATFVYNDAMFTHGMRDFALSDAYSVPLLSWLNKVAPDAMNTYGAITFGLVTPDMWEGDGGIGFGEANVLQVGGPVEAYGDPNGSDPQEDWSDQTGNDEPRS